MSTTCPKRAPMTAAEARRCVAAINHHLDGARVLLLDLYERWGWQALGYASWRACATAEFGRSQAHLYRQLEAARVEREISPGGEIGAIPERQLRPLAALPAGTGQRAAVWQAAAAGGAKPNAVHLEQLAARALAALTPAEQLDIVAAEHQRSEARVERLEAERRRAGLDTAADLITRARAGLLRVEVLVRRARKYTRRFGMTSAQAVALLDEFLAVVTQLQEEADRAAAAA